MRNRYSGKAVIGMAVSVIGSVILAAFIRNHLPAALEELKGIIFFGTIIVVGGGGTWLSGRFLTDRRGGRR